MDNTPSFDQLLDYERRSQAFKPGPSAGQARGEEWAGVIFRIGEARLTCNIEQVREFLPIPACTPVPGTKPWILGLANVHGDLLTVVDLAWFLTDKPSSVTLRTRLLVASLRGRSIGLMVDEVFGQRYFVSSEAKQLKLPKKSPLAGYVHKQYRSGSDVWQELDLNSLFSMAEFLVGAAA